MVDDLGAAPAYRAIQRPIVVEREQIRDRTVASALGLAPADPLAGVLDDLAARRDGFGGEYAAPVDA
jgi:hypothetical protein